MAENVLTGLVPVIYQAVDRVVRELTGAIPACTLDAKAEMAAVGQNITTFVTPAAAAEDITPSQLPPDTGNQTIAPLSVTITKSRGVAIRWTGEHMLSVSTKSGGVGAERVLVDQATQAMRTLVNEIEVDLCAAAVKGASRATGTAGTTPFATVDNAADLLKIFKDNGAPISDLQTVINTTTGAKLRKIANLYKANEAGGDALLRQGIIANLMGLDIRESAGLAAVTKGTGAAYVTSGTYAIGATAITLITGTGTVLAGDVVTFAGDTNKYVVATALTGGVVTLAAPGLVQTLASGVAMTVGDSYTPNVAFHRSSLVLLARQPAVPIVNGSPLDSAADRLLVTDPQTGLTFEFAAYLEHRRVHYTVGMAWGVGSIKPNFTVLLLG